MNTLFQSFSMNGLLTIALWYLAISAVCSVAYGLYEAFKHDLHTFYGEDAPKRWLVKAAVVSLLQSPAFPFYAIGLVRGKVFDTRHRRRQQRREEASAQ